MLGEPGCPPFYSNMQSLLGTPRVMVAETLKQVAGCCSASDTGCDLPCWPVPETWCLR